MEQDYIRVKNARLNNLKNITVDIPRHRLIAVTGLSGSGKSTLIFDTLHRESQRLFMGAQGIVSEGLQKPHIDAIEGLSPSIAIDQGFVNTNPRSTVGTATDMYTYFRILYARIGHRPCPRCSQDVPPPYDHLILEESWEAEGEEQGENTNDDDLTYPCPHCGEQITKLNMSHFSFNVPAGACPTCMGLGTTKEANVERILNPEQSVLHGGVLLWDQNLAKHYVEVLKTAAHFFDLTFDVSLPIKELGPAQKALLLYGVRSQQFRQYYPHIEPPSTVGQGNFEGVVPILLRRHTDHINDRDYTAEIEKMLKIQYCHDCLGKRLRPESQAVHILTMPITELSSLPLTEVDDWLQMIEKELPAHEKELVEAVLPELQERVKRLLDVGVGYLTMERSSPSLSGGEEQRLRLASLLGSGLTGVVYILDEPTVGLHQRDTLALIRTLQRLRDLGNTVIVIEHDLEIIRAADYVIELGPGAGENGGQVVAVGSPEQLVTHSSSITGQYLTGKRTIDKPARKLIGNEKYLIIKRARAHNLKNITVRFPLEKLIAVTGVSGSGKSSLVHDILGRAARQRFYGSSEAPEAHDSIEGWQYISKVIILDQEPIGRTPRSNAATYSGAFTAIRQAFAETAKARESKLTARHFSFNVPGGRCERCEGAGILMISMHFLPPAFIPCPTCKGRRFKREVLTVRFADYDIAQVLNMTAENALIVFQDIPAIAIKLALLVDVGLGYLRLGQAATTLSGGEIQRVKLATELGRHSPGNTLYLLDEPTTGLHVDDIARLLRILHKLVEAGNTVVVIEHNLDVIKTADWILDLGPEGGMAGGEVIAQGSLEQVMQVQASYTGKFLKDALEHR